MNLKKIYISNIQEFIFNASENFVDIHKLPKIDTYSQNSTKTNDETEALDYQLYGEPPPSYKQAKFYPKASACKINSAKRKVDDDKSSHIYENIDELSEKNRSLEIIRKPAASHYTPTNTNGPE